MSEVVDKLVLLNKTISVMESCTGGLLSSTITNVEGSSEVFKYGAVTYSNEYKIKMGVNEEIIRKYSVYSKEVSNEMSKCICKYTNSNYGVVITGKLNRNDINNISGSDNIVNISIYDKDNNKFYNQTVTVTSDNREYNKNVIIKIVVMMLLSVIK